MKEAIGDYNPDRVKFLVCQDVASGRKRAKSEALDKHELAIFKDGVTL